jgi:hypothetical protein
LRFLKHLNLDKFFGDWRGFNDFHGCIKKTQDVSKKTQISGYASLEIKHLKENLSGSFFAYFFQVDLWKELDR